MTTRAGTTSRVIYIDEYSAPQGVDEALRQIAAVPDGPNRYLVRVHSAGLAQKLQSTPYAGLTQIFADGACPAGTCGAVQFPPDSLESDIEDFGLALCDAVMAPDADSPTALASRARRLGKPLVDPGDIAQPVPALVNPRHPEETTRVEAELRALDPHRSDGSISLARLFGRFDGFLVDMMACLGKLIQILLRGHAPLVPARAHLRRATMGLWKSSTGSYFAPGQWTALVPVDRSPDGDAMEAQFDWMDRAALNGAKKYRDLIWIIYILAALAVFAAVAGMVMPLEIHPWEGAHVNGWALVETASLLVVVSIVSGLVHWRLQHKWTACRIGAEQLRLARMTMPLLMVPPLLLSQDRDVSAAAPHGVKKRGIDKAAVALALAKRAVREQGPSPLRPDTSIVEAARWLRLIVDDQRLYHANNHDRLEAVEILIRAVNIIFFGFILAVVLMNLAGSFAGWEESHAWLLVTACGPAAVGALHGAASRMEIARRSDLSRAYAAKLETLVARLDKVIETPGDYSWLRLRDLVKRAIDAMGSEADAWHATMLLEPVALP